jgi:hypothetical protein
VDGDATPAVVPLLDGEPEAVGLAADELDEPGWLPDDAHPASAAGQMSAAAATASRPDRESPDRESPGPESPGPESPFLEYPALVSLARGNTAVPFVSRRLMRRSASMTAMQAHRLT